MRRAFGFFPHSRCFYTLMMAAATIGVAWADPPKLTDLGSLPHNDAVLAIAWRPDEKAVVTGSRDGSVLVWDFDSKNAVATWLDKGAKFTRAVAVNPGKSSPSVLSGGRDGVVRRWVLTGEESKNEIAVSGPAHALAVSPDGMRVVAGIGSSVSVWNPSDPAPPVGLSGPGPSAEVQAVAWAGDGTASPTDGPIAAGDDSGAIFLWKSSVSTDPPDRINVPGGSVHGLAFLPDGKSILSAGDDGKVRRWSYPVPKLVSVKTTVKTPIKAFSVSADGTTVATAGDTFVQVWLADGTPVATIDLTGKTLIAQALAQDGKSVACAIKSEPIQYFKVAAPASPQTIHGSSSDVSALAFRLTIDAVAKSETSVVAAGASKNVTVLTYTVTTPTPVGGNPAPTMVTVSPAAGDINSLAFDPKASSPPLLYVAAAGPTGDLVTSWNAGATPTTVAKFDGTHAHTDAVNCVSLSRDGQTLVTGSDDNTAKLWRADGTWLADLAYPSAVSSAFLSDDNGLVAATANTFVRLWDVSKAANPVAQQDLFVDGKTTVGALPVSKKPVLSAWTDDIRAWTPATSASGIFDPGSDMGAAASVTVDSTGKTAAAAYAKNTVVLYDLTGVKPPSSLSGHTGAVRAVVFAGDQKLVSGSDDQSLMFWNRGATLTTTTVALGAGVRSLSTDSNANTLIVGLEGNIAKAFDITAAPRERATVSVNGDTMKDTESVALLAPDPDFGHERFVAGSGSHTLSLWYLDPPAAGAPAKPVKTYTVGAEVFSLAWIPAALRPATKFVTGSGDGVLRIWEAGKDKPVVETPAVEKKGDPAPRVFAVAATSSKIALGTDKPSVQIWDVKGTPPPATAKGTSLPTLTVRCLAFSPDGQMIAYGSDDQTVRICQQDGTKSTKVGDHPAPIVALAYHPGGKYLASVDTGGTLIFWDVSTSPATNTFQDGTLATAKELPFGLAWHPDQTKKILGVAVASKNVRLFDVTLP